MIRWPGHSTVMKRNTVEYIGMLKSYDLIGNDTISPMGWHKHVAFIKIVQRFSLSS